MFGKIVAIAVAEKMILIARVALYVLQLGDAVH
jgi:hypothetical protein